MFEITSGFSTSFLNSKYFRWVAVNSADSINGFCSISLNLLPNRIIYRRYGKEQPDSWGTFQPWISWTFRPNRPWISACHVCHCNVAIFGANVRGTRHRLSRLAECYPRAWRCVVSRLWYALILAVSGLVWPPCWMCIFAWIYSPEWD